MTESPDIESVWGEVKPGTVFWQDVISPANQTILESESNDPLPDEQVKTLREKLRLYVDSLELYEYRVYRKKIAYLKMRLREADDRATEVKIKRKLKAMIDNPPTPPKKPGLFKKKKPVGIVKNEKAAQKLRLQVDRIQKKLDQHEAAVRNQQIYEDLAHEMQLEVSYFAQQLVMRWSALQNREEYYVNGKRHVRRVRIEEAHYTPDSIQYKVKVSSRSLLGAVQHHLPDRVSAWDLVKPETLSELSVACERPVSTPHTDNTPDSFENGCWVIVHREGLTDGLFDYIEYDKVINKYDDSKRHKLAVPLGIMRGRMLKWLYLTEQPHLMVNGLTGAGKTNMIRIILSTLCQFNSPEEIRFYVMDLKRGGDFRHYQEIPHLAGDIITDVNDVVDLSGKLVAMMYQRMDMFAQTATLDIDDYNNHVTSENRMPHVAVVVDECSAIHHVAASKADSDMIWKNFTLMATQARAAGIHLILGTQQSFKDGIPASVRDNITLVLSGRQRTLAASMATFGTGRAKRLANIRGRMLCDDGGDDPFQIQTPYVTKESIRHSVDVAKNFGERPELELPDIAVEDMPVNQVTEENIIRTAINNHGGSLSVRPIYDDLNDFASRRQIEKMVKSIASNDVIEFEERQYLIEKEGSGFLLKPVMEIQAQAV